MFARIRFELSSKCSSTIDYLVKLQKTHMMSLMPRLYKHTSNKALLSDKFSAERDVVAVEEALGSAAFPKGLRRLLLRLARCLPSVSTPPWPCRQFRTGIGQALRRAAAQIVKATGSDRDSSQAKPVELFHRGRSPQQQTQRKEPFVRRVRFGI